MSRSKKSRKPGGAPTAKPKLSKKELANVEKRVRKPTGKVAGNRQKEASQGHVEVNQSAKQKDPRLGNKTPIALGKVQSKSPVNKHAKTNNMLAKNVANVRIIDNDDKQLNAEQEIELIEQDQVLQAIIAKQENDLMLTEQEIEYYNQKMDRHQVLSAKLGMYEEPIDDSDVNTSQVSEDELWQKLDSTSFTDFEDKE